MIITWGKQRSTALSFCQDGSKNYREKIRYHFIHYFKILSLIEWVADHSITLGQYLKNVQYFKLSRLVLSNKSETLTTMIHEVQFLMSYAK